MEWGFPGLIAGLVDLTDPGERGGGIIGYCGQRKAIGIHVPHKALQVTVPGPLGRVLRTEE